MADTQNHPNLPGGISRTRQTRLLSASAGCSSIDGCQSVEGGSPYSASPGRTAPKCASGRLKIAALQAHKSQVSGFDAGKLLREWSSGAAKGKEVPYAESSRVITLENDEFGEEYKKENG